MSSLGFLSPSSHVVSLPFPTLDNLCFLPLPAPRDHTPKRQSGLGAQTAQQLMLVI